MIETEDDVAIDATRAWITAALLGYGFLRNKTWAKVLGIASGASLAFTLLARAGKRQQQQVAWQWQQPPQVTQQGGPY